MCRSQSGRSCTIVAGGTVIGNTGMIKHRRYKGAAGYVADIAILIRWNVAGIFTGRTTSAAVMTGLALFTYDIRAGMVDKSIEEVCRVMAGAAIFVSALMNGRICCSSGINRNIIQTSIMAGGTVTGDARVCKTRGVE